VLSELTKASPRRDGESIADYADRLQQTYGDRINWGMLADTVASLVQLDLDDRMARLAAERERKAEERRQHEALVAQSSPDRRVIKDLLEVIECAAEGEKLMNQIGAALGRHRKAEEARQKLQDIYDSERRACSSLGKRAPSRPAVPKAPDGAVEFAATMRMARCR
jgi:hypothetical protein